MSRGKTFQAFGVYDFYTSDAYSFLNHLSQRFKANIRFQVNNLSNCAPAMPEEGLVDTGFETTIGVSLNYYNADEKDPLPEGVYLTYEARFDVTILDEEELFLEFLPNGVFHLCYLPFGTTWHFFIAALAGDALYTNRDDTIKQLLEVRKAYARLLQPLAAKKLLHFTNAGYEFEAAIRYCYEKGQTFSIEVIIEAARQKDHLQVFTFSDLLQPLPHPELKKLNQQGRTWEVVIVDDVAEV